MLPRGIWPFGSSRAPCPRLPCPAASSPPVFSGPPLTALSLPVACDFPHPLLAAFFRPLWLFPFGEKAWPWQALAAALLEATTRLELPSTLLLLPPCSPCAVCFWGLKSSSGPRGLRSVIYKRVKVCKGKRCSGIKVVFKAMDLRMSGNIFCYLVTFI